MADFSLYFVTFCVVAFYIFSFTVGLGLPEFPLILVGCLYIGVLLIIAWAFDARNEMYFRNRM